VKRTRSRAGSSAFEALESSRHAAEHLRVRAELLVALQEAIARRDLKQVEAARILRITQPRVSNLLRGRIDLFSTDALIDLLACLGIGVRLKLEPGSRGRVA